MMDEIGGFDPHWIWASIGLTLAALEMIVPGVYLIWLAVAASIFISETPHNLIIPVKTRNHQQLLEGLR